MKGSARSPSNGERKYAFSRPKKSPINPTATTAILLIKKLIVINIPFIRAGCSESTSLTIASRTGVVANIKNPIKRRRGIANISEEEINKNINAGTVIAIISKVFFLPILSEIVPAANVPRAPDSCKTDKEIPAAHKDPSLALVIYVGRNVVSAPFNSEVKNIIAAILIKVGENFLTDSTAFSSCLLL